MYALTLTLTVILTLTLTHTRTLFLQPQLRGFGLKIIEKSSAGTQWAMRRD